MSDAFSDIRGVSKSHIPATNIMERMETPLYGMDSAHAPHPRKRERKLGDSIEEIATNYVQSGELYNQKTTYVNNDFVSMIVVVHGRVLEALRLGQMERINKDITMFTFNEIFGPIACMPPYCYPSQV